MDIEEKKNLILSARKAFKINPFYVLISYMHQKYLNIYETISLFFYRSKFKAKNYYDNPLITVFTPTYNRAQILGERAIKSVLNQTYKNFEYIIVGDGCDDETEQIIKKFNDPRIKFYNIKRKILYKKNIENLWFVGPVRALNFALLKAKGDWLARIDDDIIWKEDHLEKSLNFCSRNKLEFATANTISVRFGEEKAGNPYKINNQKVGGSNTFFYISYLKFFKFNLHGWMKKINRVNDTDLFDRMTKAGVKTGYRDEVSLYNYPRPDEETVGIDQIILKKEEYESKYFKKN